jgi:lysophospholipase L1-like esterase
MRFFIWLLLGLLAGQPVVTSQPAATASKPALNRPAPLATGSVLGVRALMAAEVRGGSYLALGDSISAGKYAGTAASSFPDRISSSLGMRLWLVARSGATTEWAMPRLGSLRGASPALVTIELGTNDAGMHTPMAVFARRYQAILTAVSKPRTRVLCLGSWLPAPGYDLTIRTLCERAGGTFVGLEGFYAVNAFHAAKDAPTFNGPADWFHPSGLGHAAIAAEVLAALAGGEHGFPGLLTTRF